MHSSGNLFPLPSTLTSDSQALSIFHFHIIKVDISTNTIVRSLPSSLHLYFWILLSKHQQFSHPFFTPPSPSPDCRLHSTQVALKVLDILISHHFLLFHQSFAGCVTEFHSDTFTLVFPAFTMKYLLQYQTQNVFSCFTLSLRSTAILRTEV